MSVSDYEFDKLWEEVEFEFKSSDSDLPSTWSFSLCPSARKFAEWANALCSKICEDPSPVGVNQALLQLTKTYYGWLRLVPKQHRNYIGDRGHVCIYQVWLHFLQRLIEVELNILPQVIIVQPRPQYQQVDDIWLGEED